VGIDRPKKQLTGCQAVALVEMQAYSSPGFNQAFSVVLWDHNKKPVTKSMTATPAQVSVKMVIQADAITVDKAVGFTVTGQPASGYRLVNVTIAPLLVQAPGFRITLAVLCRLAPAILHLPGASATCRK